MHTAVQATVVHNAILGRAFTAFQSCLPHCSSSESARSRKSPSSGPVALERGRHRRPLGPSSRPAVDEDVGHLVPLLGGPEGRQQD